MWGLWDLYRVTGDATARDIFDRSRGTLLRHLGDYEYDGYVLYERYYQHYCYNYYWLQMRQLRAMTGITGDLRWADRADVWSLMRSDPDSVGSLNVGTKSVPTAPWLPPDPFEGISN